MTHPPLAHFLYESGVGQVVHGDRCHDRPWVAVGVSSTRLRRSGRREESLPNRYVSMTQSTRMREQARVLLVDESPFVLQGLRVILAKSRHIRVVGTARSITNALAAVQTHRPTVVVSDVEVGRASGIELCRAIRESHPKIRVLFFTGNDDQRLLRSAILAGAQGYLLKRASSEAIVRGIEIVSDGMAVMDPQVTPHVISWVRDQTGELRRARWRECSQVDLRMLASIAAGKSNKEIAQRLKITPGVLGSRLRRLYKRLNISRRAEAAMHYVEWRKENRKTGGSP